MALRLVQLSDIHFSTKVDEEKLPHDDVRGELLNDLRHVMVPNLGQMHKILIAGDVAFSGKREEYEEAARWLEEVTAVCQCKKTDVLAVPGNHDVDRSRILPAVKSIHNRLRTCSLPDARHELVELARQNDGLLTDKLTDYQAFASSYGCPFQSPAQPHWAHRFSLADGFVLNFMGLTTVQICDATDEKGGMLLGRHQYIIERKPREEVILVMHHPPEWLKDRQEAFQYLDSRARVHVFGHEHLQEVNLIDDGNARLVIASGALTPENAHEPYIYRYNILEFSLGGDADNPSLSIAVHPRKWNPDTTRFEPDRSRLKGQDSRTFTLPCPQFQLRLPEAQAENLAPAAGANIEGFMRLGYFFWRYLSWQEQLRVLVESNLLPATPKAPTLQTIAHLALDGAKGDKGKLNALWDKIMMFVPPVKREPNPFVVQNN
jgi:predicted phosphodiesterase